MYASFFTSFCPGGNGHVIEKRGDTCHAEEEDHDCPPGVDCNPPAPRTFPCPPGVTEDKPLHFAELPDTTCVLVPDGCEDTRCATEKIDCPPMKQLRVDDRRRVRRSCHSSVRVPGTAMPRAASASPPRHSAASRSTQRRCRARSRGHC